MQARRGGTPPPRRAPPHLDVDGLPLPLEDLEGHLLRTAGRRNLLAGARSHCEESQPAQSGGVAEVVPTLAGRRALGCTPP